jgi:hypothetical protein
MVVAGLVGPAGAAARSTHGLVTAGLVKAKPAPPNVNIQTPGPNFSPTSVVGKKVPKSCKKKVSFTISNTTAASQDVDFEGSSPPVVFATIPAGDAIGVCGTKKFKATVAFYLVSNSSAQLTVTIT